MFPPNVLKEMGPFPVGSYSNVVREFSCPSNVNITYRMDFIGQLGWKSKKT